MEAVKWPQRASGPVNFTPAASDLLAWELLQTLCLSAWWEASLLQELWSGKRLPARRGGWEILPLPLSGGKAPDPHCGHCPDSRLSLKTGTAGEEEKKSRSLCPLIIGRQLTSLIQGRYDNDS